MAQNEFDAWLGIKDETVDFVKDATFFGYNFENNVLEIILEHLKIDISVVQDDVVRINIMQGDESPIHPSYVKKNKPLPVNFIEEESYLMLKYRTTEVKISLISFSVIISKGLGTKWYFYGEDLFKNKLGNDIAFSYKKDENPVIYGLGEKAGYLDKNGEKFEMYNTDVYRPHNQDTNALYQSHPFYISKSGAKVYGLFMDNPSRTYLDFTHPEKIKLRSTDGPMDLYLYIYDTIKEVVKCHTNMTGKTYLPPKWALGHHQSRWGYTSEGDMIYIASEYRKRDIPLDVLHFDIPYMDGYRVFTFDEDKFESPKEVVSQLKDLNVHTVPIVDPGVKQDGQYDVFIEGVCKNYFCQYESGEMYIGNVWPGNSVFPDFAQTAVRDWWGEKHKFYTDLGIEGIWNDMNEPAIIGKEHTTMDDDVLFNFDGKKIKHKAVHNLYGLMMGESTKEAMDRLTGKRTFLLTRAGYPGIQKYAAVWTGDNRSFWEHLQMFIPMCMNLGLSGVSFCGPDIGGFSNSCNGELLTRWYQAAIFAPFYRNHNSDKVDQEPWVFGDKYEHIIRDTIIKRYVYMPYLYQQFVTSHKTGMPIMRPLVLENELDENTYNLYDAYLVGSQMMVAPILQPSKNHRVVYFPEGLWWTIEGDKTYKGKSHELIQAPLNHVPIFIKDGSIIPKSEPKMSTKEVDDVLILDVYASSAVSGIVYYHYEDDGATYDYQSGDYLELKITYIRTEDAHKIVINNDKGNYKPSWDQVIVHVISNEELPVFVENGFLKE